MITDFRIALGAVFMTVVRNKEIENLYKNISVEALKKHEEILSHYQALIKPIDDQRSNKIYEIKSLN